MLKENIKKSECDVKNIKIFGNYHQNNVKHFHVTNVFTDMPILISKCTSNLSFYFITEMYLCLSLKSICDKETMLSL